jgi:ribonucleoside-triphosphate reductase
MRSLEEINKDLALARDALAHVEGRPAEVYSRIVGYYRSVRNWNKGKREEYSERKLFSMAKAEAEMPAHCVAQKQAAPVEEKAEPKTIVKAAIAKPAVTMQKHLLLFVRRSCPNCPPAKVAASKLGIPVEMVDAGTEGGLAEAARRNVCSTPTAILLSGAGQELARALDSRQIAAWGGKL